MLWGGLAISAQERKRCGNMVPMPTDQVPALMQLHIISTLMLYDCLMFVYHDLNRLMELVMHPKDVIAGVFEMR